MENPDVLQWPLLTAAIKRMRGKCSQGECYTTLVDEESGITLAGVSAFGVDTFDGYGILRHQCGNITAEYNCQWSLRGIETLVYAHLGYYFYSKISSQQLYVSGAIINRNLSIRDGFVVFKFNDDVEIWFPLISRKDKSAQIYLVKPEWWLDWNPFEIRAPMTVEQFLYQIPSFYKDWEHEGRMYSVRGRQDVVRFNVDQNTYQMASRDFWRLTNVEELIIAIRNGVSASTSDVRDLHRMSNSWPPDSSPFPSERDPGCVATWTSSSFPSEKDPGRNATWTSSPFPSEKDPDCNATWTSSPFPSGEGILPSDKRVELTRPREPGSIAIRAPKRHTSPMLDDPPSEEFKCARKEVPADVQKKILSKLEWRYVILSEPANHRDMRYSEKKICKVLQSCISHRETNKGTTDERR